VHEDAVVAVAVGLADGLVGHGQDPRAVLARRLGDELLEPQPEAADLRVVDDERSACRGPAWPARRACRRATAAVLLRRVVVAAALRGDLRAVEQRLEVGAHERRRHEAEVAERAVAPADVRVGAEDLAEAVVVGELLERRARVGHRDELPPSPVFDQKYRKWLSVSTVPPDFEETTNSVF
jgi:hypothetical protein